jgi:hypothetical protein
MKRSMNITALCVAAALLAAAGVARAGEVALVPTAGDTTDEKRAEIDEMILASLVAQGHDVFGASETKAAMDKLAMTTVESLKDADLLGSKLKVEFVVIATVAAMAGQDSLEVRCYFLPEGRMELLEEIAAEGESKMVLAAMLGRLVTKGGLAGETAEGGKPPPPVEGEGKDIDEAVAGAEAEVTGETGEGEKEGKESEDEKLVKDLQTWPEKDKDKRIAFGIDYRIALELGAGPTVMLNKPVAGGRAGGFAYLSLGYMAVAACGCEFGGEARAFFGPVDAFSIAAFAGFNFRLSPKVPLYAGGKLSLGYLKNISGARSNRMILRGAANFTFLLRARYMIIINPASIVLLAFDGDAVAFYDAGLGFGVRF